jgi:DMSO/TMAO reductase YedYZ molybdopterin-dependent catalytic subunit
MKHTRLRAWALALGLVVAFATAALGALSSSGTGTAVAAEPVALTVVGNGTVRELTLEQVKALTVYEGWSGMKNSAGTITPPAPVKGVKLSDLFAEVGGITEQQSCDIIASDGYGMTMTYGEVTGGAFTVYNASTGAKETPKSPLSSVLIYERDGQPISYLDGGPLRIAISQTENVDQVADGHWLVKWVDRLELRAALPDWKVRMYGLKRKDGTRQTSTLDRSSFLSCAAPGCHGRSWVSSTGKTWSGVNLSYIMGRVDGGRSHGDDALNLRLAMKGYRIKLVAANGTYKIVSSRTMLRSKKIILANKREGVELAPKYYPLRLVGPYLNSSKFVGRITKIYMLPK